MLVFRVVFAGRARFNPKSPRLRDDLGVVMACNVGYGIVAVSDARKRPVLERPSSGGAGSGRGREKSREFCKRRAVGDVAALDIASSRQGAERSMGCDGEDGGVSISLRSMQGGQGGNAKTRPPEINGSYFSAYEKVLIKNGFFEP